MSLCPTHHSRARLQGFALQLPHCRPAALAGGLAPLPLTGCTPAASRTFALPQVVITCDQPGPTTSSPLPLWTVDFGRPLQQANPLSLFRVAGVYRCAPCYTSMRPHASGRAALCHPTVCCLP